MAESQKPPSRVIREVSILLQEGEDLERVNPAMFNHCMLQTQCDCAGSMHYRWCVNS